MRRYQRELQMKIKILAAACIALASLGASAEWVEIASNGESTLYADPESVRRSNDLARMWHMEDFKAAITMDGGMTFTSTRTRTEFNCNDETQRRLYVSAHSKHMAEGGPVLTVTDVGTWKSIPPKTKLAELFNYVCELKRGS